MTKVHPAPGEAATVRAAVVKEMTADNWTRRRFRLDVSLIFLGACIAYLVFLAPDDELRRSLPLPVLGTFGSLLVGYFGFANNDDKNRRSALTQIATEEREPE